MSHNFSQSAVNPIDNRDAYEKLFRIEKKLLRRKSFSQGMLVGVLLIILLTGSLAFVLWLNKEPIAEYALDYVISSYLQDLFVAFPDAYVSNNQHKILPILDEFTNAAAAKKVTGAEFKHIGRSLVLALKDKQLTYHEITNILTKMKTASKSGYNFN